MLKVFGTKKLMSQVFSDKGELIPVTVIDLDGLVVAKKDNEIVHLGFGKKKNTIKSEEGNYKELGFVPREVMESDSEKVKAMNVGEKLSVDIFENIDKVDVTGVSKGKGFASVIKRWGFKGGPKTHGQSDRNRAPGSIGAGSTPGKVFKGKKMGGRMGNQNVTVKNLQIVEIDKENNLVLVKGAIPGARNSVVIIKIQD